MKIKRLLCMILAFAMVITLLPSQFGNVAVAEDEQQTEMQGTSKETLDELRIPSDPISVGAEGDNPFGNGTLNMYPRYELFVRNYIDNKETVYDYDKSNSGKIIDNLIKTKSLTSYNTNNYTSASTALDLTDSGRKDYIARIVMQKNGTFSLKLENKNGDEVQSELLGQLMNNGNALSNNMFGWEISAHLQITSGDYDGDGYDEVAVYNPKEQKIQVYRKSDSSNRLVKGPEIAIKSVAQNIGYDYTAYSKMPRVNLTSGNLEDANFDSLITTVSGTKAYAEASGLYNVIPVTNVLNLSGGSLTIRATYYHAWDYKKYDSNNTSGKTQISAYGAASVGDVDGDGKTELVLAGYDFNEDSRSSKSANYNKNYANIAIVKFNFATQKYEEAYGGVGQTIAIHPTLASGIYNGDNLSPISVACFKGFGSGNKDLIFLQGNVYSFEEGAESGQYSGIKTSSDNIANQYGYKLVHQTSDGSLWSQDEKCWYGDKESKTDNIWIEDVVVGNFKNDPNGCEQVVFVYGRKRDDENEYRHDIVSIYADTTTTMVDYYKCINNNRSSDRFENLDITAADIDEDGVLLKYRSKAAYFSDPKVVAVLQAAPFFGDLESFEPDYVEDGSTVFGKSSGTGSVDTNGFEFSASIITGWKTEAHLFGISAFGAGASYEVDFHASLGGEWESSSETTYTTTYESDSRDDRVVLCMTPYIRYVYDMYMPAFTIPTEDEYNKECTELAKLNDDGYELSKYKEKVEKAINSGYGYGSTIPAGWDEYIVCVPQTPRMSMVEVSVYDEMAEKNGFEKIKGNVLKESIGDPRTYPSTTAGLANFDGGKDIVGADYDLGKDGFVYVSKGGGTVTQSIETSDSSTKYVTWGAGVSNTNQNDAAGLIVGIGVGFDYTGSHGWSDFSSTSCEGTVAGIPNESVDLGYDFKWRFGQWTSKVNGEDCIVLGYLTKDIIAPPSLPQNIAVKDTTDTTVTLNWNHPTNRGTAYNIFMVTDDGYYKLASVDANVNEYVVENLTPNTSYSFAMTSVGEGKESAYSNIVTAKTKYSPSDNVLRLSDPEDIETVAGDTATFTVSPTPAVGGGPVQCQWQEYVTEDNSSSWEDMRIKNSPSLQIYNVSDDDNGRIFRCKASQLVNGSVMYIYSNSAKLLVGKAKSETTLSVSPNQGSVDGVYTQTNVDSTDTKVNLVASIGSNNYNVMSYDTNKYVLVNDSGDEIYYVGENEEINTAVGNNSGTVALGEADIKLVKAVYEYYVTEDNQNTGIKDVPFTEGNGSITVTTGTSISYTGVIDGGANGKIYKTGSEDDGIVLYYTKNSSTYKTVESKLTKYSSEDNTCSITICDFVPVTVTESVKQITYENVKSNGTEVILTATVESIVGNISNISIIPTGTVEFEIVYNNDKSQTIIKSASLGRNGSNNSNSVSVTWVPQKEGMYKITARYKGDSNLNYSVSEGQIFNGYFINPSLGTQTKYNLILDCDNEITYGESLSLKPILRTTVITKDGEKYTTDTTDTDVSTGNIDYTIKLRSNTGSPDATINSNIFTPNTPETYVIEAHEKSQNLTATKTVVVDKKELIITANDKTYAINALDESNLTIPFDSTSITLAPITTGDEYEFVGSDEYEYDGKPFFALSTDATKDSGVGEYTITVGEQSYPVVLGSNPTEADRTAWENAKLAWENAKADFFSKYDVSYNNGKFTITGESYQVNYSHGSNGTLSVCKATNGVQVKSGDNVIKDTQIRLNATPDKGYTVDYWTINGEKYTEGENVVTDSVIDEYPVSGKLTIQVFFKADVYKVNYSVLIGEGQLIASYINNGQTLSSPVSVYSTNEGIQFTANPDVGYTVKEWRLTKGNNSYVVVKNSDNTVYSQKTYTLQNIDNDYKVEVVFETEKYFHITTAVIDSDGNKSLAGTITVTGGTKNTEGKYQNGSSVTINAVSNDTNTAQIKEWRLYTDSDNYTVLQGNTSKYVIENLQKNYNIKVVFDSLSTHNLSFSATDENGTGITLATVTAASNQVALSSGNNYQANIPVDFVVAHIPDAYEMVGWNVNGTLITKTEPTYTLPMLDKDTTVYAVMRKKPVVTFEADGTNTNGENGTVEVSGTKDYAAETLTNGDYVDYNSKLTVIVTPTAGYIVEKVLVGGNECTFTRATDKDVVTLTTAEITTNTAVTATYQPKPIVTITNGANGTVAVSGTKDYAAKTVASGEYVDFNSDLSISITPNHGYVVDTIKINSTSQTFTVNNDETVSLAWSGIESDTDINITYRALNLYPFSFNVVDTNGADIGGTFGTLKADVDRNGLDSYKTEYDVAATTNGSSSVYENGKVTFTATPDLDYRVKEWTIDGVVEKVNGEVYKANELNIDADRLSGLTNKTITVQFELGLTALTYTQPENGTISAKLDSIPFTSGGNPNGNVTFTITPDTNYEIKNWVLNSTDLSEANNTYIYAPDGNSANVTAVLQGIKLNINAVAEEGGIVASPSNDIRYNDNITLRATPNAGYAFEGWYLDGARIDGANATYELTATKNATYTANFVLKDDLTVAYKVNNDLYGQISADVNGTSIANNGMVQAGQKVTFTVTPGEDYRVKEWTGLPTNATISTDKNTASIQALDENADITCILEKTPVYTITINATSNGAITAKVGNSSVTEVKEGTIVTITAIPDEDYMFKEWTDDAEGQSEKAFTVTVNDDLTVGAVFGEAIYYTVEYGLYANSTTDGAITATANGQYVAINTEVQHRGGSKLIFTATPEDNMMVKAWRINGEVVEGNVSDTLVIEDLDNNVYVTVEFEDLVLYSLPDDGVNYTINDIVKTPDEYGEDREIRERGTVTFKVVPAQGKQIAKVSVNEDCGDATVELNTDGSYTVTVKDVNDDIELDVAFKTEGIINIITPVNGTITVKKGDTVLQTDDIVYEGDVLALSAQANNGFRTKTIKVHDNEIASGSYTVNASDTELKITAEFEERTTSGGGGGGAVVLPTTFTVKFDTNGGSDIKSQDVEENEKATKPDDPTKEGFTFDGWFSDAKLTDAFDFGTKITEDTTLYAKWSEALPEQTEWVNPFDDVEETNWYKPYVEFVNKNGYMKGMSDKKFGPKERITRGMFVTILYRIENEPASEISGFMDVKSDKYYTNAIGWASAKGLVLGKSDTVFDPDAEITREQMAAIVLRYAKFKDLGPVGQWDVSMDYVDMSKISDYASEAVMFNKLKNIMIGTDTNEFHPKDNTTRAEAAAVIERILENLK